MKSAGPRLRGFISSADLVDRIKSGYASAPFPNFEVMAVQHLFGLFESGRVVFADDEGRGIFNVVVACKRKNPIFGHGHSVIEAGALPNSQPPTPWAEPRPVMVLNALA